MAAVFEYAITNKWIRRTRPSWSPYRRLCPRTRTWCSSPCRKSNCWCDSSPTPACASTKCSPCRFRISTSGTDKARIRRTWSDDGEGRMQLGTQKTVRRGPSPCRSLSFPNWRSRPPDKARTSSCSGPNAADASTTRAGGHASGIPACATRAWRARL